MAISRRTFLKGAVSSVTGAVAFPYIIPSSALGADGAVAPSNRVTMGCIGVGRMGTGDMNSFMGRPDVQIVAVCDVDSKRVTRAKENVDRNYAGKGCRAYGDFRELVEQDDIDTTLICTPDHWHVLTAIAAAKAGKDIYVEKPLSYTISEGRALCDAAERYGRVIQVGSQQRSESNFRFACELVRNGRIGKVHTVKVGLEGDPGCDLRPAMPVPPNLNYEMWLGPAPWAAYTEERVHPQDSYERPGWLRMLDYGAGMITGWGAHHIDIGQWGLGTEDTGPVAIEGHGAYPRDGLWDVHAEFHIEYTYADGRKMIAGDRSEIPAGVRFEGDAGWIHVDRGELDAEPKSLLRSTIGPNEIHLYESHNHHANFIECVKSRRAPIAEVQIGHRSCSICLLGHIAMQLRRKLRWDPARERFVNDPDADRMLSRTMRSPWRI